MNVIEAHVEVYARYLREKLEWEFPINAHLRSLLNDIVSDSRWDFTFLGMQVVIEGLALAAFGFQYQLTKDPLLKQITRYIMADEARHVAFGVLSLREVYADMSASELRQLQEFCYECALRMRDRFLTQEVWEVLGLGSRVHRNHETQSGADRVSQGSIFEGRPQRKETWPSRFRRWLAAKQVRRTRGPQV